MSLAKRFAEDVSLEYSLMDRIRIRGHMLTLQTITMLRMFFQQIRGVQWINPSDLRQATDEFVHHVEQYAEQNDIPLITARPGESHVDQAAEYLHRVVQQEKAVYCIIYQMRDNLFVAVDDTKVFRRAIAAFTPRAIERFCHGWVYDWIPLFPRRAQRRGFHYRWFLDQVEYSHNLIFRHSDRLNALFGRLLDRGRAIGQPHVIARLFQRKRLQAKRTGGRMQRTQQEDYVVKAWHKKTYIKQYNKQGVGLGTETSTHDVREFGIKKGLHHLPYLLHCMGNCNKRLLRWQDTIDQTTIPRRFVEKLGQPTVRENGQRVPGLNLHNPRLYLVLAAVLQFAHVITGFRNSELRTYLQRRFGLSPDEYTAAQLRYDLLKLRGKGWIRKLDGKTQYVLTPQGITQGTALAKLNECLNGTLGCPISEQPLVNSPQTDIQKCYRKVRNSLQQLLETSGIAA